MDGRIDASAVAGKVGVSAERLFKTLVARTDSGEIVVYCIPGITKLELKKAARAVGAKSIELVHSVELRELTGCERGGCSPIGMNRSYSVRIEESALFFDRILLSGEKIGLQIEIPPLEVLRVTGGQLADLV